MADEIEVETKDLQETIEEIHKEREEREEEERRNQWTRYIALTTALLAAFAAVAALKSGSLANEGMVAQLQASDRWAQYQSSRTKVHLYTLASSELLDRNVKAVPETGGREAGQVHLDAAEDPPHRLREYLDQVSRETEKQTDERRNAEELQKEAKKQIDEHHRFAYSVAMLQVAIALGAVSALTRMKSIWLVSSVAGIIGIVLFAYGFIG
ncbi:MAG TPA: DUF4337 domain-containing protein [Fimbriimonas sp.]|nr:DUF4337 domain-containing protein [Fimbriimonas sp.]